MSQYKYAFHRFQELNPIAKGADEGASWIAEKLNSLGEQGIRVINLSEAYPPSGEVDALGRGIPYYVLTVLGEQLEEDSI